MFFSFQVKLQGYIYKMLIKTYKTTLRLQTQRFDCTTHVVFEPGTIWGESQPPFSQSWQSKGTPPMPPHPPRNKDLLLGCPVGS